MRLTKAMEEQEKKIHHRPDCKKFSIEAVPSTSQDEPLPCDCEIIKNNLIGFCNDHNYFIVESRPT